MTTAGHRQSWVWICGACTLAAVLLSVFGMRALTAVQRQPYTTWSDYAGSADSMQYSALDQVHTANVGDLEEVWSHMASGPSGRFSFGPLIVDDVMYVVGKDSAVVALEAATGRELWSRPLEDTPTNRGFNYWESADRSDRRLIFAVRSYLRQIDARTGELIQSFGRDGRVDLREGIPRAGNIQSGTPGRVFENLIILGSATGESYGSPPGDLRAFDVRSGRLVWTFNTIPRPGEFGYDTWPHDAWTYAGGANTWGEISIDEKRGIVYFPTGSPTFDLYGGDRHGANLFGNCLLALDARTGKRLWHYQLVHHDLWDYDLVASPKLLTVRHQGRAVDVVAQASKTGMLYVFDRVTGEPLWPIEERPVPASDVPGEQAWPTQPFTTTPPPFSRLSFDLDDLNPHIDADERAALKERLLKARNEGVFTPPTLTREFLVTPGQHGGANFGAVAADPATGMVYVRTVDAPSIHQLSPWDASALRMEGETPPERGLSVYAQACQVCHGEAQADGIRTLDRAAVISLKHLGPERVTNAIRQGQGQMPAFPESRLSSGGLEALLAYLADPTAAPGPARIPPPLPLSTEHVRYTGPLGSTFRSKSRMPAIAPPWSRIVAYDLNEGTIKWAVPLGTVPVLAAKGITDTGNLERVHRNGLVVTAGGLIFVGSYGDRTVRAFAKDTGKILWERKLPAGPEGMPAVYEAGGRQYVAFFASTPQGGESAGAQGYYVFGLPGSAAAPPSAQSASGISQPAAPPRVVPASTPRTPAEINALSRNTPITSPDTVPLEDRRKIEAAVPKQALVTPKRARTLLVLDFCTGYVHTSIPHANHAIAVMGKNTGAYEAVFDNDLANLKYENIRKYDAVFLNNTVGDIFADPEVREGLLRFVRDGGGLLGLHGSSYASLDWPAFGEMIGATTAPHRIEPGVIKVEEDDHPLTAMFGGHDFEYVEEYYRFPEDGPYSRDKLRVLLSINVDKTDLIGQKPLYLRSDKDYGISWVKSYGKGRVFNTSLGHRETMFMTPVLAQHVLAGIQFVLGDLEVDTTPSAKLATTRK